MTRSATNKSRRRRRHGAFPAAPIGRLAPAVAAALLASACVTGELVEESHPQREIVGQLEAGQAGEEACVWVVDATGRRWVVFWPTGWEEEATPGPRLRDAGRAVVAGRGDTIRATGPADAIGDSICGHDVFLADSVVVESRATHEPTTSQPASPQP